LKGLLKEVVRRVFFVNDFLDSPRCKDYPNLKEKVRGVVEGRGVKEGSVSGLLSFFFLGREVLGTAGEGVRFLT
jgi:hypothetical protein